MKNTQVLQTELQNQIYRDILTDIYIDKEKIPYQTSRYINALQEYEKAFGSSEVEIYSAPGRSEIGGNHTDHQHGEVLAASINNDAIAIVKKLEEPVVKIISDGYDLITIPLDDLEKKNSEEGTTVSLIRGVLAGTREHGYTIGGFQAYVTSDVLIGAGLSSSAAFETIIGTILSGLYNDMSISAIEIAIIGQFAENIYFGKPCGLMDQMACSVGSLVHIDFADPEKPVVNRVEFDLDGHGYSLCITDTKGSHADLTADYAAVPEEMKKVAAYFGKEVLRDVTKKELFANLNNIREAVNDRAALRAIHFNEENERVQKEVSALQADNFMDFLDTVKASGDSSFKYLQNVYTNHDVEHQNVSIALAASDSILGKDGVSRVHGGGFAGTIQAFVKNTAVQEYKNAMDAIFGEGSCNILKIRKYGGMKVL
ncbi:MAG: galactokinase [Lachnospiraceae bacterium]|nr:galactokinase [Lachnospiraceae bacterium]